MRTITRQIKVLFLVFAVLFGAIGQTACDKDKKVIIEENIGKFTRGVKSAREVTTVQHTFGHLTNEEYVKRLKLFKSLYKSIDVLGDRIVEFGEINSTNKAKVLEYIRDVNTGLIDLLNTGDLGVTDEAKRQAFTNTLLTASIALSSLEVIIAAAKDPLPTKEITVKAPVE